ncbi:MCE family protein [Spirillospora sp. NPDC048819]|uniref:MCE family protein n=1 Tax=Spirillospora sp. NPDC048819 TaxID=3155268 RepID=UPI00341109E2
MAGRTRRLRGRPSARGRARAALLTRLTLFVLVTGVLTAFIGLQIARVNVGGGWRVTATFDDASGLTTGDEVKIAGAPVGRVDGIEVVDGRARVRMTVRDSVRVPADSEAAVRWRDAMGRRVVYLIPGTSPERMRPGAHITRTRSVVDAGELLAQLAPLTRSIDPKKVNQVLVSLAQALDGNAGSIERLIVDVDRLSSTIAARRSRLGQMLDDYATVTTLIARRDKQIGVAVDDLVSLSKAFADNRRLIDRALVQLAATARTSDAVLSGNADRLAEVIGRLARFSSGVERNAAMVASVLSEAGPKLQHIFAATDNGRYVEVAAPCVSLAAPPCPYPTGLPGPRESGTPIDDPAALKRLLVGGS